MSEPTSEPTSSAGAGPTFTVVHRTEYQYGTAMSDGYTVAHLLPRETPHQTVRSAEVHVTPDADEYDEHIDMFGNRVVRLGIHHPHEQLGVTARSVVVTNPPTGVPPGANPDITWEAVAVHTAGLRGPVALEVAMYLAVTASTPALPVLRQLTDRAFAPGRTFLEAVRALCHLIYAEFVFDPGFSDVSTPIDAVVAAKRGVCQDFAHLAIACLRSVGLAARYVSGYIETTPPPGKEKVVGGDASHAWCSVWAPGHGWCDLDPTNDHMPPDRHVTVAWGRDYFDVAPVRGVVIGPASTQHLSVDVDVARATPT